MFLTDHDGQLFDLDSAKKFLEIDFHALQKKYSYARI